MSAPALAYAEVDSSGRPTTSRPRWARNHAALAALVLSSGALVPFLVAFRYIHPAWDDPSFYYEVTTRGFFRAQLLWYNAFSGRYASDAIVSVLSLTIHSLWLFRLLCLAIFATSVVATYWLLRVLLQLPRLETAALTGLVTVTHLVASPGIAEGVYWMTGSATYTLGVAFLFFGIAEIVRGLREERPTWVGAAWIAIVVGMNEVFLLLIGGVLALLVVHSLLFRASIPRQLLIWSAVAVAASVVAIAAPGNWVRLEYTRGPLQASANAGAALLLGATSTVRQAYYLMQAAPTIALLLLGICLMQHTGKRRYWMGWPLEAARVGAFAMMIFIVLAFFSYILTVPPIPRIMHAVFAAMIVMAVLLVLQPSRSTVRSATFPPIVTLLLLAAFASGVVRTGSGVRRAASELLRGDWRRYDLEMTARYRTAERNRGGDLVVDPVVSRPTTIFVFDVGPNPAHRHNVMLARFLGLRSLATRDSIPTAHGRPE